MNKFIVTTAALLMASTAYAGDLPSKATPAAPVQATASAATTITAGYGYEFAPNEYDASTATTYSLGVDHSLGGGLSVGAAVGTSQAADEGALKQTIEASVGYKIPLFAGITAKVGASIGERFTNGANYPYYTLSSGADYKLADNLTLNAIGYRYRNAIDDANDWESHQLSTGATFALNKTNAVFVKLARSYDSDFEASTDAITVGYKLSF